MKTIKKIDLLNKIANGEEVPKKIRYKGDYWYLKQDYANTLPYYSNGYNNDNLFTDEEKEYFSQALNYEVEIIEDTPNIDELVKWRNVEYNIAIHECSEENLRHYISIIMQKQNDIIDKLTRENDIRKAYFRMIKDIGYDYDGYRKAENLMILIDELIELAQDGLDINDKKVHYVDAHGKTYNILMEEVNNEQ